MSKPFHFKQFTIEQERCAMKVGTDGVLLGAWAKPPLQPQQILDIGTGSGVIALMLAQRFPSAKVTGIDIEQGAYEQAQENFQNSVFASQLTAKNTAIQNFNSTDKFDLIVSNPPFFTQGILPENTQRQLARHTSDFSFEVFFEKVSTLLTKEGILAIVFPKIEADSLIKMAVNYSLFCQEYCTVFPNPSKPAKRALLTFGLQKPPEIKHTELTIENNIRHEYTEEYQQLLKDFYLAF